MRFIEKRNIIDYMKKISIFIISILFAAIPAVAKDAVTADLRVSLTGGGTWVKGSAEFDNNSVDYKTNWQPFGFQEACDFFIRGFFIGIHEEIGMGVANLNTKDFKTVGKYNFSGKQSSDSYGNNNILWFINVGPVFALRPAKVISFNIAPFFGFEQMWRSSTDYGHYPSYNIKTESDYAHGFNIGIDLYTRLRFNRFLIVGGVKASAIPSPTIISTSSELIGKGFDKVNGQSAISVKWHIGFGIEIGERL